MSTPSLYEVQLEQAVARLDKALQAAEQELAEAHEALHDGAEVENNDNPERVLRRLSLAERVRSALKSYRVQVQYEMADCVARHEAQQRKAAEQERDQVREELTRLRAGGYLQHLPTCRSRWCSRCMLPITNADHRSPWGSPYNHVAEPEGCTCQLDPQSRAE